MGTQRNASLDALRCFAMLAIVLCHVYQHNTSIVPATSTKDMLFLLLIRWHVDVFVGLSGWFGVKFSAKKFFKIWGLMAFYSVVSIFVGRIVMGNNTPLRIDGGWFGNTYLCFLLVAPFINAAIENLVSKGSRQAWLAWAGFAVMMICNWVSRNCYFGILAWDVFSHSLVQMVFVYFTVRLLRLTDVLHHIRWRHVCIAVLAFVMGCIVFGKARTDYIAPYTIAMAIALIVIFDRYMHFPQWANRAFVRIAPLMFGVYLIHEPSSFGKLFHQIPLSFLIDCGINPIVSIILSAVVCFGVCMSVEVVRKQILRVMKLSFDRTRSRLG